jgi:NAD(P)-dependent dehydrogenase (short-subunit alcohol dehydrogenase family)
MFKLRDKIALVTGAGSGIGAAIAETFAGAEARVIVTDVNEDAGRAVTQKIKSAGGQAEFARLDVSQEEDCRRVAENILAAHGRLDVLVNNAGVWATKRAVTKDGLESTFGVNHVGTALLTQELLPLLEKSAPSRVVVVSSDLHYRGKMQWDDLQQARGKFRGTAAYNQS